MYRCLLCDGNLYFDSKLRAAMHVRECHADELEHRHVDEFIVGYKRPAESAPEQSEPEHCAPYQCRYCDQRDIYSAETAKTHISNVHALVVSDVVYGRDFISHLDAELEHQQRILEAEPHVQRFALTLQSVNTVADFLTECRV